MLICDLIRRKEISWDILGDKRASVKNGRYYEHDVFWFESKEMCTPIIL